MVAVNRNAPNVSRFRTPLLILIGVAFVVFLSASGVAKLYTDYLFFDRLELASVWRGIIGIQSVLVVLFALIFFSILYGNLFVADRASAKVVRPTSPDEDLVERYRELVGPHSRKVRLAVSGVLALLVGLRTATEWDRWILFRNGGDFGWVDPLFERDAGFYVFRLPFWTFLTDWFTTALLFALIAVTIVYYLNGSLRPIKVESGDSVKTHVSVLLAGLAILRAISYWLDRFELVNSSRGVFDGALATDVQIQLPALNLLMVIALFGAALFVANIWRPGWGLPVAAVALWAISHVVVGGIFPALYQRLRVEPVQSTRERDFIGDNIEATRFGFGIDPGSLEVRTYEYTDQLTSDQVEDNSEIFERALIVDPRLAQEAFGRQQGERSYYQFAEEAIDVDRYQVDGAIRSVLLSVRGLEVDEAPSSWEDQHVVYTHGYGVAVARGDQASDDGLPSYLVEGIGPEETIDEAFGATVTQPRIYFGENFDGYALVKADGRNELDFPSSTEQGDSEVPGGEYRYDGKGGVGMSGVVRRLAFALRFQELNPLISGFVGSDTEVIYNRDIEDRVRLVAPFLRFDSDPYPVVVDGGIKWIVDAYTTTDRFPYAQQVQTASLDVNSDLRGGYNYVRNSVKAVVDAFDGSVTMYVVDPDDPIAAAYAKAFPALFSPQSELSAELESHFRYPGDLFSVQTDMLDTYQVTDPRSFLQNDSAWSVAAQPDGNAAKDAQATSLPMRPQYATTQLPGEDGLEFVIMRAFVPEVGKTNSSTNRPEVTAFVYGRSDPENYGQLVMYKFPQGQLSAPDFVDSDIKKDDKISAVITPLSLQGSKVLFGEMVPLLVDDTVVYVRPMYVEAETDNGLPELNRIIAVNGSRIAMGFTLQEALDGVVIDPSSTPTRVPNVPGETPNTDLDGLSVAELTNRAGEFLDAANLSEANGDATEAARLRAAAADAIQRLQEVLGITVPRTEDSGEA